MMKKLFTILIVLCISLCAEAQVSGGQISRQKTQNSTQKSTPKTTPKTTQKSTQKTTQKSTPKAAPKNPKQQKEIKQDNQKAKKPKEAEKQHKKAEKQVPIKNSNSSNGQGADGSSSSRQIPQVIQNLIANMVRVEGGTFTMGSNDGGADEKPTHQVTLTSFSICRYEVTQEEWEAVMGSNPSRFKGAKLPVEQVSWNDCQTFIQKLNQMTGKNFRLPTEAEWEYAARGGNKSNHYKYSGSNDIGSVAWYEDNSGSTTHPVGQKSPNELGLYDMSGNVWEWCADWYGENYYSSSPQSNPKGPSDGSFRVFRGGSWFNIARCCRVSYRSGLTPSGSINVLGLRLAF